MALIIRSSAIHAAGRLHHGARTAKALFVVEYTGPRITKDEADNQV